MTIASLLTHTMDVMEIPAPPVRDASGGIVDSGWGTVAAGVPCAITPAGASRMGDFALAGERVTHTVITLWPGLKLGQRLRVTDPDGLVTYLRVALIEAVRQRGTIGPFYRVNGEEVRLQ